jgi:hypothetical protein
MHNEKGEKTLSFPARVILFIIAVALFVAFTIAMSRANDFYEDFPEHATITVKMHRVHKHHHPRARLVKPQARRFVSSTGRTVGSIPATGALAAYTLDYIEWLEAELIKARRECTCLGFLNGRK